EVTLYQRRADGSWIPQPVALPARGGAGAGPPTAVRRPPLSRVIAATTRMVAMGLRAELRGDGPVRRGPGIGDGEDPQLAALSLRLDQLARELDALPSERALGDAAIASGASRRIGASSVREQIDATAVRLVLDRLRAETSAIDAPRDSPPGGAGAPACRDAPARRDASWPERLALWRDVADLVGASVSGIVRDGVLRHGLGAIDAYDLREWLGRHGAGAEVLERSP